MTAATTEMPPATDPGPYHTLRSALRTLAEAASRRQADLHATDAAHTRQRDRLEQRLQVTSQRAARRHPGRLAAVQRSHQARLETIDREHDDERNALDAEARQAREAIAHQTRGEQLRATRAHECERLHVGAVFEDAVTQLKLRSEQQRAERYEAAIRLEALCVSARQSLEKFRVPDLAWALEESEPVRAQRRLADDAPASQAPPPPGQPVEPDASDAPPTMGPAYPPSFDADQPAGWSEDAERRCRKLNQQLARSPLPNLFVGARPWVLATGLVVGGSLVGLVLPTRYGEAVIPPPVMVMGAGVVALFGVIGAWWLAFRLARRVTARLTDDLLRTHGEAAEAVATYGLWSRRDHADRTEKARLARDEALRQADSKHLPVIEEIRQKRRAQLEAYEAQVNARTQAMIDRFADRYAATERAGLEAQQREHARIGRRHAVTRQRLERDLAASDRAAAQARERIATRWDAQREAALATLVGHCEQAQRDCPRWDAPEWDGWSPPYHPAALATFGNLGFTPARLLAGTPGLDPDALGLPASLELPAALSTPGPRSWMIEAEPDDRAEAMSALRSLVLRVLTTQPPGRVRLTLLDPVALGESFAALMHLSDHDEQLVNSRVWSEPAHMERRLVDLTDHMALVIQKYLRNDFETIEAYNAQAGELAEPYRFLVMADFPHGLTDEALARLSSIASTGPRCGVYLLMLRDPRQKLLNSVEDDLRRHCVTVRGVRAGHAPTGWAIRDDVLGRLPLTLDAAPDEARTTTLIQRIGAAAVAADRVQVPFSSITPTPDQFWSADSAEELSVPIGRTGATRLQRFTLGHGVEQHALVAGKTGSGKSSLLHALVTNLGLWYPPDQLEVYLIDFKKGVEFKPYVTHRLPHARAVAIESDRAFGLSILRELDRLMDERGQRYREAGVQGLGGFRRARPQEPMPRVLLVVDEFQELFSRDDALAQDAAMLLDRLVRQGRAFGVHALLGSQSLSGAAGLARGTLGQMAVRIALQCNEADSQLILSDENAAARQLGRPGEAIYNPRGGDLEGNSVFQVAWLPDHQHVETLRAIEALRQRRGVPPLPRAVFEGNAPALLADNADLRALLDAPRPAEPPVEPLAYLGEPIAIEAPTALRFPRQPGAHALVVGGSADTALPLFQSAAVSLAAQFPAGHARLLLLNGSAETSHDQAFAALRETLAGVLEVRSPRDAVPLLAEAHAELQRRLADEDRDGPAWYLLLFGLQRFREFRKREDSFSYSLDGEASTALSPDQSLGELLRDGPAVGMHILAWADRAAAADAVFDRRDLREFDQRVLFQMSANDSAQLIDQTDANDLGAFRALLHREDRGTLSRFRPYGPPTASWLQTLAPCFR